MADWLLDETMTDWVVETVMSDAHKEIDNLKALLRRVECCGECGACPLCDEPTCNDDKSPHKPDCELAKALT